MSTKCVHCGYCCKKVPCLYGKANENKECSYLKELKNGDYICGIIDKIKTEHKDWKNYPAFGEGCCCGLNSTRIKKLATRRNNKNVIISDVLYN